MTVKCYMDNLNVLHNYGWETTNLAKWLSGIYFHIKVKWGKLLEKMGMDI